MSEGGSGVAGKTEKIIGAWCAIHSAHFLLMHLQVFKFFVRMQTYTVNPASPSTIPTSLSHEDSVSVQSQAARKGGWGTPVPPAVCSPTEPESSQGR